MIKQLLIDEFSGRDSLTLDSLDSGLNVIRVPSAAEAAVLHAFVPAILVGATPAEQGAVPPLSGSIVAQVHDQLLDLCRLPTEQGAGSSDLHVLNAAGEPVEAGPLHEALQRLTAVDYLALYTDRLLPAARLAHWRSSGLLQAWCAPSAASPSPQQVDLESTRQRQEVLGAQLQAQLTSLQQQQQQLDQQLAAAAQQRPQYLEARAQVRSQRQRLRDLEQRRRELRQLQAHWQLAAELGPDRAEHQRLEQRIDELQSLPGRPVHARMLQQVQQQLDELRPRLQQARQRARSAPDELLPASDAPDEQLDALVADGTEAITRQVRCDHLQARITDLTPAPQLAASDLSRESARELIRQLRQTAAEWRAARRAWQQEAQCDPAPEAPGAAAADQPAAAAGATRPENDLDAQARRAPWHDEVRQVQLQTQRMLQRRVLSPPVLAAIGLLFALGVLALLASLFLDLANFEWLTQVVGVSCVLAASLLQWNLERTPTAGMRQQRLKIERLLAEISPEINAAADRSDATTMDGDRLPATQAPSLGHPPEPAVDQVDHRLRQCEAWSELVTAEQRWRELLQQHDLPPDMSPREAIVFVRQRTASGAVEATSAAGDELSEELAAHQAWLRHWRHRAAQLLEEPLERLRLISPQQLLHELAACRRRRQLARSDALRQAARQEARRELKTLQDQWKQLTKQQQRILRRAQVESLPALRAQLAQRRELNALQDQLQPLRARIEQRLRDADAAQPVRDWLDTHSSAELAVRAQAQQDACARIEAEWQDADRQLRSAQARIAQLIEAPAERKWKLERTMLAPRIEAAQAQLQAAALAQLVLAQVEPRPQPPPRTATVERAAELLRAGWAEPELQLDYDPVQLAFQIARGNDPAQRLDDLPELEQQHVVVCLQLALLAALAAQHLPLPLVLQAPSLGSDAVARRTAALLCDVAGQGQQILLVTIDPAVTSMFQDLDMPTLVVSRMGPASPADLSQALPHEGATA